MSYRNVIDVELRGTAKEAKMIKSILFFGLGAIATYLYLNPGDFTGAQEMVKDGINKGATVVMEATK
tara:strand:- start:843 stop:1043 length:201 start_codon:yes stop_codon:yes gene_type:complete